MAGKPNRGPGRGNAARPSVLGAALVVEDDPIIALSIAETLQDAGAEPVETCTTTEAARAALERLAPALVVLDVHLADRADGWAFAELLPLLGPHQPQLVFATGSPEEIPPEIAALGTVLPKPFTPADLLNAVTRHRSHGLLGRIRDALAPGD